MKACYMFLWCMLFFMVEGLKAQPVEVPPGVVVAHVFQETGKYIGSPGLCILPDGSYLASHDEFGPKTSEYRSAQTHVFRSTDKGRTW